MGSSKKLFGGAGVSGGLSASDVFSVDLYTGNGTEQVVTTGVDYTEGALVYFKRRASSGNEQWFVFNTEVGSGYKYLKFDAADSEDFGSLADGIKTFSSNSITLDHYVVGTTNSNGYNMRVVSIRKAENFFDILTWTGDGSGDRNLSHSLNNDIGFCMIKCRSTSSTNWETSHISRTHQASGNNVRGMRINPDGSSNFLGESNSDNAFGSSMYNTSYPLGGLDETTTLRVDSDHNQNGRTYIAFLFAHDTSDSSLIKCGTFNTSSTTSHQAITLGWRPQWLLFKATTVGTGLGLSQGGFEEYDVVRGLSTAEDTSINTQEITWGDSTNAETNRSSDIRTTSTGFSVNPSAVGGTINGSNATNIIQYVAIREDE